jgi:hypothetical protein
LGAIAIYVGYNFEAFKAMALNAVKMFVNLSIGYLNKWIGVFNAIADTLGMDSIKIQLFDKLELEAVPKLKSISQVAKEVKRDVAAMFGTGTGSPASDPQVAAEGFADANLDVANSMNVAKKSAEELKKEEEELRKKYEGFNQMLENQMSLMKQYVSETQREVEDQLRSDIQFLPTMEPVDMDDIVEPEVFTKLPKNFAQLSLAAQDMSKSISDSITSAATSFAIGIGEMLGSALAGGEGFKNFGQFALMTLAGLLQQVGEMAVQTGIALMGIKVALKTLNPAVAIAGGIALIALASGIKTSLAKRAESIQGGGGIPMLAEGGIATGPTLAMIGEGRGPEAVIPLDKLEGMLSGGFGGQNVVVTGRIQGSDILISSERAQRERSRYRGF